MTKSGQTYYYHYNGHGDVTQLTDQSGNVVANYTYDAWGNILQSSGSMAVSNPYRYAGYRYDTETGLYYLMARYYSPVNGVFLSIDPEPGSADDPLNLNPYVYTRNNPVMFADPDGKWIVDVIFLVVDAAAFTANPSLAGAGSIAVDIVCFADPSGAASTIAHAGKAAKVADKGLLAFKGIKAIHGNSLKTTKEAIGYTLRDKTTGEILKYGETTRGSKRYTKKYLRNNNADMISEARGTKKEMHDWQHEKILKHKKKTGKRPRLNKSDW